MRSELEAEPDTAALFGRLVALDPAATERMEPTNRRRVIRALEVTVGSGRPFSSFGPGLDVYPPAPFAIVGLDIDRSTMDDRIADRYDQQMARGFLDEAQALLALPDGVGRTARQALGYAELFDHLENRTALDAALDQAVTRTRRFARRPQRWFRRDPRIVWLTTSGAVAPELRSDVLSMLVD